MTLPSFFGKSIKITITEEKIGSRIQAESKPKMENTLFDYGQNKEIWRPG